MITLLIARDDDQAISDALAERHDALARAVSAAATHHKALQAEGMKPFLQAQGAVALHDHLTNKAMELLEDLAITIIQEGKSFGFCPSIDAAKIATELLTGVDAAGSPAQGLMSIGGRLHHELETMYEPLEEAKWDAGEWANSIRELSETTADEVWLEVKGRLDSGSSLLCALNEERLGPCHTATVPSCRPMESAFDTEVLKPVMDHLDQFSDLVRRAMSRDAFTHMQPLVTRNDDEAFSSAFAERHNQLAQAAKELRIHHKVMLFQSGRGCFEADDGPFSFDGMINKADELMQKIASAISEEASITDHIPSMDAQAIAGQILLGVAPDRSATHVQKFQSPASSFAGDLVAYEKLSTMYAPLDCAEEEGKGAAWNIP